ncbi:MAG: ParB/RepB/Spo0J family partition protein [Oscillospiraceae bacterium]|nr:ParB/RepB/Spo0J family partition protein [Oscillospiraceae bacterium]
MQAIYIPIQSLHPFAGHPYKVQDNDEMNRLIESIQEQGILTPLIVRPLEGTAAEYEVISGHRRLRAAQKAGLKEVPAFIHAVDRDEAAIQLVDSNLHRENILPSEKAYAYKLKMDALDHRGRSCGQVGHKSRDSVSDTESGRQVQRYIRLTHLLPGLLDLVDEGRIAFTVGVELSYLTREEQRAVLEAIELYDCTPSYSQACRLHRDSEMMYAADTRKRIQAVMAEEKPNQREKVSFQYEQLRRYFPSDYTPKQMTESILQLLERERRRRLGRDAR